MMGASVPNAVIPVFHRPNIPQNARTAREFTGAKL